MSQSEPEPGPSGTKRKRTPLFTVQEIVDYFEDFSELDGDNDEDYPVNDLESESDSELDLDDNDETRSRSRSRSSTSASRSADRGVCVPITDRGDEVNEDGWNKIYQPNDSAFDGSVCGPKVSYSYL